MLRNLKQSKFDIKLSNESCSMALQPRLPMERGEGKFEKLIKF